MLKTLKEAEVWGKRVLLRGDLDVPLKEGKVGEDYRLKALLPTLNYLLERGARVLIVGHAGRPEGKADPALSLKPVAGYFSQALNEEVALLPQLPASDYRLPKVALLENLRFWKGEEENDPKFAKDLAGLADLYVNDSFASSHRAHASTAGVKKYLSSFAGLQLQREMEELSKVLKNPARPLVFLLGGAKIETKEPLVPDFAKIADLVLLGGLLMFSKKLEGLPKVLFAVDAVSTLDIGPKSIELFLGKIREAQTVVWNGPVGKWEEEQYAAGTRALAQALASHPGQTIVGGGDTIAAISSLGLLEEMSYVSLGGGAMLEFLAGKKLPGLTALGYS